MEEKMPNAQEFCLRWNNFHSSLVSALDGFKNDEDFVDVTLACEGQFLKAHKMLLSACSVFFRDLLKANPCQHPIVILPPEVKFNDLEKLLRFIYQGEVNVQQENLARFLKTAEMLKIRGLAEDNDKMLRSSPRPPDTGDPPNGSPKRPRLSTEIMSAGPQTPHSHNDDSRLSGGDSDSEMIPVKQEMVVEFKDNDAMYEGGESEPFSAEAYLREGGSTTSSSQPHPPPPPPPGPLIPSYVPPPQVKSQDDSLQGSHLQDEITQGTFASLVADHPEAAGSSGSSSSGPQHHHILHHLHSLPTPQQPPSHTRSSPASLASSRGRESDEGGQGSKNSVGGKSPGMVMSVRTSPGGLRGMIPQSPGISLGGNSPGSGSPHLDTTSSPSGTPKSASGNSGSPLGTPLSSLVPSSLGSSSSPSSQSAAGQVRSASLLLYPSTVGAAALTCDICFKTFTSRSNLNKHKRVQHSGEEYVCPICKRSFKNRYYIKEHVLLCSTASQKKGITTAPDSMPASEELALPTDLSSTQPTDLTSSAQAVDLATSKSLSPT